MSYNQPRTPFTLTIVLCLFALALTGVPQSMADTARAFVLDASLPGHRLLSLARERFAGLKERFKPDGAEVLASKQIEGELQFWKSRFRRMQAQNGLLKKQLVAAKREGVSPYRGAPAEPLVVPQLLEAAVLGQDSAAAWRAGTLIDRGAADGLRESTLVLEEENPLVDQGTDAGLEAGQPVFAGRTVVGKIEVVGRWTSTIQPLTDVDFRAKAQLARKTPDGIVFASAAILEGTGDSNCRLKLVPADEAVSVGDEVYSNHNNDALPYPLYYGKVVQANLKPGASHWEIHVEPAVKHIESKTVQVLTRKLNPVRLQAN